MTAPDLHPSLVKAMKEHGVDVTTWDPEVYDRLKKEMSEPGTSIVHLSEPRDGDAKIGVKRRGGYVKILGAEKHVLYPKGFIEHQGCHCPTSFVMDNGKHKSEYDYAIFFVRDHFGITAEPGAAFNFPPGTWPDIKVQEVIEYPIPFTYEAWPVSVELSSGQFDPTKELISKIDGSRWVWAERPPKN